ncbi:MAG: glycosyltransferase family 2 protein [Deltaproteobacteria bacterium]|nr:glycosyltransferase family 2 protein [Deltaproteobacteria bacterium]
MNVALIVPTLNAAGALEELLPAIQAQTRPADAFLAVDSSSTDGTCGRLQEARAQVIRIRRADFNHGRTRQLAVEALPQADVFLFLTQDAVPVGPDAFGTLLASFEDDRVGAAYGRQLPRKGAGPIEAHARLFNYPDRPRVKTRGNVAELGIKAAFISNSFAAYRRDALAQAGGFPGDVIFGEDTCVAARMLLQGWKVAYCADAQVYHSHGLSAAGEFRRYFDIGVLHSRQSWIQREFGTAGGEGLRYVASELRYLWRAGPASIPSAMIRNALKIGAYRLGLAETSIPLWLKSRLSLNEAFWRSP